MDYYEFVETTVFTRDIKHLLSDDEYAAFQLFLTEDPQAGDLIRGTGGCRKIRWARSGSGKRSGVRVICYFCTPAAKIYMLLIYRKNEKDS